LGFFEFAEIGIELFFDARAFDATAELRSIVTLPNFDWLYSVIVWVVFIGESVPGLMRVLGFS
jgi:hypothetical protein